MSTTVFLVVCWVVGFVAGVLLERARHRAQEKREREALEEKIREANERGGAYRSPAENIGCDYCKNLGDGHGVVRCLVCGRDDSRSLLANYGQVSKWPSPEPAPAPKKPDPSTWRFRGDCGHCGSLREYALREVKGNFVACIVCGRRDVYHYPSNRVKKGASE